MCVSVCVFICVFSFILDHSVSYWVTGFLVPAEPLIEMELAFGKLVSIVREMFLLIHNRLLSYTEEKSRHRFKSDWKPH